jgi:hypothetical protein
MGSHLRQDSLSQYFSHMTSSSVLSGNSERQKIRYQRSSETWIITAFLGRSFLASGTVECHERINIFVLKVTVTEA